MLPGALGSAIGTAVGTSIGNGLPTVLYQQFGSTYLGGSSGQASLSQTLTTSVGNAAGTYLKNELVGALPSALASTINSAYETEQLVTSISSLFGSGSSSSSSAGSAAGSSSSGSSGSEFSTLGALSSLASIAQSIGGLNAIVQFTTKYNSYSKTVTTSSGALQAVSPTTAVNKSNSEAAGWFLTCPTQGLGITSQGSFVGGNACLNPLTQLQSEAVLNTKVYDFIVVPPFSILKGLTVYNIGALVTQAFMYSPEVDGELSNGFSTDSYIFNGVPSFAQHAIWTWTAPYADFSQAQLPAIATYKDTLDVLPGYCTYGYTYTAKETLNWIKNVNLPFDYANGNGGTTLQQVPVFPYLFFDFNITMNSQTTFTSPNLTGLSDGIFTPLTYGKAYSTIEPFPIDIGSVLIANFTNGTKVGGILGIGSHNSYSTTVFSSNGIVNLTSNSMLISGSRYNLLSVAATPNNYIYLLLNNGQQDYIAAARAIQKGYYQANISDAGFPSAATCTNVGTPCVESTVKSQFNNAWNGYWKTAMAQDNTSVYLVTQPSQFIGLGTDFKAYNMSVDYQGNLYILGTLTAVASSPSGSGSQSGAEGSSSGAGSIGSGNLQNIIAPPMQQSSHAVSGTPTYAASAPSITASYDSSTGSIDVTGSGFSTGCTGNGGQCQILEQIVSGPTQVPSILGYASVGGGLSASISSPTGSFAPGTYLIEVENVNTNTYSNQVSVTVPSTAPSASSGTIAAIYNLQSSGVQVTGSGFGPNDNVVANLYSDAASTVLVASASGTAGASGQISILIPLKQQYSTVSYYAVATDQKTNVKSNAADVSVPALSSYLYTISAAYVENKNAIVVTGSGFDKNTAVTVSYTYTNGQRSFVTGTQSSQQGTISTTSNASGDINVSITGISPSASYTVTYDLLATEASGYGSQEVQVVIPQINTGETEIMKLKNTNANVMCTNASCFQITKSAPSSLKNIPLQDIAASPNGAQLYLVGQQDGGEVYVLSGNDLSVQSDISLDFEQQTQVISTTPVAGGSSSSSAVTASVAPTSLNITYYLSRNGLFNQSIPWLKTYETGGGGLDQQYFHHPLGIADVNGYVYVLDDWKGIVSSSSSSADTGTASSGIFFNIVMLRVLNSTGANVPLQPTFFNDMWSQQTCLPAGPLLSNIATCYSSTDPTIQNAVNSQWCQSPSTGETCYLAPVPGSCSFTNVGSEAAGAITGTTNFYSQYECISAGTLSTNYTSLATGAGAYGQNVYPPYGWILTANVTGVNNNNVGNSASFCSSFVCTKNPDTLRGAPNAYHGGYLPLGPEVKAVGSTIFGTNADEVIYGTGFSVNYNYTASILFSNSSNPAGDYQSLANWGELLIANVNWQNYTNVFSGVPQYSCFVKGKNIAGQQNLNVCNNYNPVVDSLSGPIYLLSDPFRYYENLGSSSVLGFLNQLYSTYNSGNAGSGTGGGSGSIQSQISQQCTQQVQAGQIPIACTGQTSEPSAPDISNLGGAGGASVLSLPSISVPLLQSEVTGEDLVPYAYSATLFQDWTGFHLLFGGYGCPYSISNWPPVITNKIVYTYQTIPISVKPTPLAANIEGGNTYLEYQNALNSGPYIPNLSDYGTYLQPQVFFNISTDRLLGGIYVNITTSKLANKQILLNATQQLNYRINTISIGTDLKLENISSVSVGPYYGTSYAAGISNPQIQNINTGFNFTPAHAPGSSFVDVGLFNIYEQFVWDSPLKLYINSTAQGLPYGYQRLIYVLQDRFNNSVYVPIDADIAKFTVINMSVFPTINASNANQTHVVVNGTVGYYKFNTTGLTFAPLTNSPLYLYYNNNINYLNYPTTGSTVYQAQLCTFGSQSNKVVRTLTCALANPLDSSQQEAAGTSTYAPQYNDSGSCSPPAKSLLPQVNYTCNIYGNNNLPTTCQSNSQNPEYCQAENVNGDGLCTSQLGLIEVVKTGSSGNFSANFTACGIGTSRIIAQYYGSPSPEPVNAIQAPLGKAANPAVPDTGVQLAVPSTTQVTFPVLNYTWLPNDTARNLQIGLYELAYGNVDAIEIIGAIAVVGMVVALRMAKNSKQFKKARKRVNVKN